MLNIEWLDAFVTFAEHLNFTRAARARHLSQPALHAQVRKLSEALDATLYRKRGTRLELTADGRRVVGFGREMRERMSAFAADLQERTEQSAVVLCAGEGAYLYLLGEGIRRFGAARRAELRLLSRDNLGTVEAVLTGEAHLGVASLDAPPAQLHAELLTEVHQVVVLPSEHPLARKRVVRLADLAGARLVVPPLGRPHRMMIGQAMHAAGAPWEVAVETSGWELLVRFAELGMGLAIVNGFCRIPPGLVARPLPELPPRSYYLLRRAAPLSLGAAALADALRASASAWKRAAVSGTAAAKVKPRRRPAS